MHMTNSPTVQNRHLLGTIVPVIYSERPRRRLSPNLVKTTLSRASQTVVPYRLRSFDVLRP
ncbi:hypothetical protein DICSQDRAFT_130716 [Dichomitus squalens LYAD-421 SS1]|uniref:uncharacterized protein n=1 Tax=Dichomitus squalens (strain LYAD-421) TaxID=732165 RepID=UPI0004412CFE|nr:uncharacterized protein DICSQDRAFT_130716 [Dichomitus squalens LYAD-421 SS1]EJF66440.1 hypothetical protein DICSQDRAFT_130716 [Dichomitus squalens LYAD-421 SS1]